MASLFIFINTVIDLLVISLLKNLNISNISNISIFIIILSVIANSVIIILSKYKYKFHIILSYMLRIIIMFFDIYCKNIFSLPNSGVDTENFYNAGIAYMNVKSIFNYNFFGGLYSKIIGSILFLIGDCRIYIQYLNIILSIFTIMILTNILDILNIKDKVKKIVIIIFCYFPNYILISSLLLRESLIIFFLSLGIMSYVKYVNSGHYMNLLYCSIFLIISSLFHSGMIIILICIIIGELLINRNLNLTAKIFVIATVIVMTYALKDIIFVKFITQKELVANGDDIITVGGSTYTPRIHINNIKDIIKYGWIKSIYFLASPTISYWRGVYDIISFSLDSMIYIIIIFKIIFCKKKIPHNIEAIYKQLLIGLVITIFVFGLGTTTAGTAIRHRNKLLIIFLVLYGIIENYKIRKKTIIRA